MKKYICLVFLVGLFACQEEDLVRYTQEKDAIQFSAGGESKLEFNFATAYEEIEKDGGVVKYYLGDSIKEKKFSVVLDLQGFPSPDERPYKLKTVLVKGQDSSKVAQVVFESYYSLAPNQLKDTIEFTVIRPEERGLYTVGLALVTEDEDAFFEKGVEERSVYRLDIKDRYEEPDDWKYRKDWLGEFDEEKYAFMISKSGKLFGREDNHMWNETDLYNAELRRLLQEYNDAHPQDKKKFEFPVTTKMVWWDNQKKYLGEFSEEKYAYIKETILKYGKEDEELDQSSKLEYWNHLFRFELKKEGRTDIEFPEIKEQSFWWKEAVLGSFSVEKQDFVVLHLFPISYYQISEETWTYANVMLRLALEDYKEENPDAPVNFDFPVEGRMEWWDIREYYLGDYSDAKRDLVVQVVFNEEASYGDYNIDPLLNPNRSFEYYMELIKEAAEEYNVSHPDAPIEFPVVAPEWWPVEILGDYSSEKETFMKETMSAFGAEYSDGAPYEYNWNPVFRYELEEYNTAHPDDKLDFEFPIVDVKWPYWDKYKYLGDYSEAKKVFVVRTLSKDWWGVLDDWSLGYGARANYVNLIAAYNEYNATHAEQLPFTFPETFPN